MSLQGRCSMNSQFNMNNRYSINSRCSTNNQFSMSNPCNINNRCNTSNRYSTSNQSSINNRFSTNNQFNVNSLFSINNKLNQLGSSQGRYSKITTSGPQCNNKTGLNHNPNHNNQGLHHRKKRNKQDHFGEIKSPGSQLRNRDFCLYEPFNILHSFKLKHLNTCYDIKRCLWLQ